MKGPFFVKDKDQLILARVCRNCRWLAKDETCCIQECPLLMRLWPLLIEHSDGMDEKDQKGE